MKMNKRKVVSIIFGIFIVFTFYSLLKNAFLPTKKDLSVNKVETKISDNSAENSIFTLMYEGKTRRYGLHIPKVEDKNAQLPLVIIFHGGASNIAEAKATLGWDTTADSKGFIAAYPEGTGAVSFGKYLGLWNAGSCCGDPEKNSIDDVGFIKNMIEVIAKDFPIDRKRIYLTGISNGSMMAIRTACELSPEIAAIGTVAGQGQFSQCDLVKPVPFIYFHGTADKCAPINGGTTEGCYDLFFKEVLGFTIHGEKITFEPAESFIEKWKNLNHTNHNSKTIFQNGNASCVSTGFQTSSEVVFCKISGMGHTWPGQLNYGTACEKGDDDAGCKATKKILGEINQEIHANEMIWDFFSRHSL